MNYTGKSDMGEIVTAAVNTTAAGHYLAGRYVSSADMRDFGGKTESDYSPVRKETDKANKAQQEMWALLYSMADEIEALRAAVVDLERNLVATMH